MLLCNVLMWLLLWVGIVSATYGKLQQIRLASYVRTQGSTSYRQWHASYRAGCISDPHALTLHSRYLRFFAVGWVCVLCSAALGFVLSWASMTVEH
jgi:hypothetical protein